MIPVTRFSHIEALSSTVTLTKQLWRHSGHLKARKVTGDDHWHGGSSSVFEVRVPDVFSESGVVYRRVAVERPSSKSRNDESEDKQGLVCVSFLLRMKAVIAGPNEQMTSRVDAYKTPRCFCSPQPPWNRYKLRSLSTSPKLPPFPGMPSSPGHGPTHSSASPISSPTPPSTNLSHPSSSRQSPRPSVSLPPCSSSPTFLRSPFARCSLARLRS